ncbi:hypothetical protein [Litoreibacter janthinus]|uniref:Uncharacterized protein n=1 Tax=Litoreibacter janthinus TaxID=670154 RepID=A0A1I6FSE9_9RHOB|nr:hypothetical protein [Litoreibacter janthinus]SFR32843.1 hypothetical protein SAMN04488002_0213 [Litoreibacter janthinus]
MASTRNAASFTLGSLPPSDAAQQLNHMSTKPTTGTAQSRLLHHLNKRVSSFPETDIRALRSMLNWLDCGSEAPISVETIDEL